MFPMFIIFISFELYFQACIHCIMSSSVFYDFVAFCCNSVVFAVILFILWLLVHSSACETGLDVLDHSVSII